jgi:excisionase family DNA binding protein
MSMKARQSSTEPYLTVAQAAQQLLVHPSTIRRWIDRGRLAAYRLGDKRIGVRPSDLVRQVTPRSTRAGQRERMAKTDQRLVIAPLTREDQRRGLQALAELERLGAVIAARHGKLIPESWELINRSRDKRTRELMQAIDE